MININCDLCGKVDERFFKALIEDVELTVCSACSKFGKIISQIRTPIKKVIEKDILKRLEDKEEKFELLVEDYADLIKKRRESLGLTQKDFALRINEKESMIHKIETGVFEPSLEIARKLEKTLGLKLIEEHQEKHETSKREKDESFTLGDFIKVKK